MNCFRIAGFYSYLGSPFTFPFTLISTYHGLCFLFCFVLKRVAGRFLDILLTSFIIPFIFIIFFFLLWVLYWRKIREVTISVTGFLISLHYFFFLKPPLLFPPFGGRLCLFA